MTFSICVREDAGEDDVRFGVAVTTRLPGVGTLCPFVSENGAIATQSLVNVELGRRGIEYVDEGLAVDDALQALLNADEGRAQRQLHGVDADASFVFSGEECNDWYGHLDGGRYTVAGNLLVGEAVIEAVAETYEATVPDGDADAPPLAERLIDALAAGHGEGGDRREELPVQSAAVRVRSTAHDDRPFYDDLRVDATETPIVDLRTTYEEAVRGQEIIEEHYSEEEPEADDVDAEGEADDE